MGGRAGLSAPFNYGMADMEVSHQLLNSNSTNLAIGVNLGTYNTQQLLVARLAEIR